MPEEKINIYHDKEICFRDSEKEEEPKINPDSESKYNQMVGLWELNEKKDQHFWRNHEMKGVMDVLLFYEWHNFVQPTSCRLFANKV